MEYNIKKAENGYCLEVYDDNFDNTFFIFYHIAELLGKILEFETKEAKKGKK